MIHSRRHYFPCLVYSSVGIIVIYLLPYKLQPELISSRTITYNEYNCSCSRQGQPITELEDVNLCSDWSRTRGKNQSVIAYTLYGDHGDKAIWKRYYNEIEDRIKEANLYYPGWIIRLYHNFNYEDELANKLICKLYCKYPTFDPCQVNNLKVPESWMNESYPNNIFSLRPTGRKNISGNKLLDKVFSYFLASTNINGDISPIDKKLFTIKNGENLFGHLLIGKMWRFLPMADNFVGRFLVRDVDSYILPREVAAVEQWLYNYPTLIHAMRDHQSHNGAILAGMWGGIRWIDEEKLTNFMKQFLIQPLENYWDYDQVLLRIIVWPKVLNQIVMHDSYFCKSDFLTSKKSIILPFPTQRNGTLFVSWGPTRSKSEREILKRCPIGCRPQLHKDWEYC